MRRDVVIKCTIVLTLICLQLTRQHISLLNEMHLLAQNVIEVKRGNVNNFLIGFHNQPSMQRLHMHVISKDFISDCLKTKKHWNSFNTALFLTYNGKLFL